MYFLLNRFNKRSFILKLMYIMLEQIPYADMEILVQINSSGEIIIAGITSGDTVGDITSGDIICEISYGDITSDDIT